MAGDDFHDRLIAALDAGGYRVGSHYGIHVYDGDRPVATFHDPDEAARFVAAINQEHPMTSPTTKSRLANDYRAVAHDELAKADDILDRHDKPRGAAAHHRVAIAHAALAVDDRLAAQAELLNEMAKMARYQADRLDEIHLVLDERLGKPTETRIEVHQPTYQPAPGGIDLTPTEFTDFLAAAKGEPVDVTEEPPVESCGDLHPEDRDAFCLQPSGHDSWHDTGDGRRWRVDTAPDVDPDEELDEALESALNMEVVRAVDASEVEINVHNGYMFEHNLARVAREHIETEVRRQVEREADKREDRLIERAEKAEADVERLTHQNRVAVDRGDKAEAAMREEVAEHDKTRATVLRLTRERDDLHARIDDLIRERGQAIERYRALRQDAVGEHLHARHGSKAEASLAYVLDRDDERGKSDA